MTAGAASTQTTFPPRVPSPASWSGGKVGADGFGTFPLLIKSGQTSVVAARISSASGPVELENGAGAPAVIDDAARKRIDDFNRSLLEAEEASKMDQLFQKYDRDMSAYMEKLFAFSRQLFSCPEDTGFGWSGKIDQLIEQAFTNKTGIVKPVKPAELEAFEQARQEQDGAPPSPTADDLDGLSTLSFSLPRSKGGGQIDLRFSSSLLGPPPFLPKVSFDGQRFDMIDEEQQKKEDEEKEKQKARTGADRADEQPQPDWHPIDAQVTFMPFSLSGGAQPQFGFRQTGHSGDATACCKQLMAGLANVLKAL